MLGKTPSPCIDRLVPGIITSLLVKLVAVLLLLLLLLVVVVLVIMI
jgi:hypothetical protein